MPQLRRKPLIRRNRQFRAFPSRNPREKFPDVISASLRESFNKCHRKLYWEQIYGIAGKGTNVHLHFGSAFAAALETFRITYYTTPGDENSRFEAAAIAGFLRAITYYGNFSPPEGETKNFDRLISAYIEYLVRYDIRKDPIQASIGPDYRPRVEFSFAVPIREVLHPETGNPLIVSGRFDMLADFSGSLYVYDDKTTKQLGASWSKQWDLRSQFTAYVWGAQQSSYRVIGAIIRGMGILKNSISSQECIVFRPQWMVDRWYTRLIWDLKRMVECWKADYWPNTGEESGACSEYGGCPYVTLCSAADPTPYIEPNYRNYRYLPLEREGAKTGIIPEIVAGYTGEFSELG